MNARLTRPELMLGRLLQFTVRSVMALLVGFLVGAAVGPRPVLAQARSVADGVYTAPQASRGAAEYEERCANCHGKELEGKGVEGPALAGEEFIKNWQIANAGTLFSYIKQNMPKGPRAGSLSAEETADLVAFMFSANKFPAGKTELESTEASLAQIRIEAAKSKGGAAAPATAAVTLDFNYFRDKVEPIFLKHRPGHARCVSCHGGGSGAQGAQFLVYWPAEKTAWTEEESRKNFAAVSKLVVPGVPLRSKLLLHPLRMEAGGDLYHQGGKHWDTPRDPEYQILYQWVKGAKE